MNKNFTKIINYILLILLIISTIFYFLGYKDFIIVSCAFSIIFFFINNIANSSKVTKKIDENKKDQQ